MSIISNTFGTEEPQLKNLLRYIEDGKMQLPDFQRGWVWDDARIRSLIASIISGYPVGAAMFLEYGSESLRFQYRTIEGAPAAGTPPICGSRSAPRPPSASTSTTSPPC